MTASAFKQLFFLSVVVLRWRYIVETAVLMMLLNKPQQRKKAALSLTNITKC
jgi:hypothetical protein